MRLLVIRTSAMGDVALTLPALRAVMNRYPEAEIVMLTRQSFAPFFNSTGRLTVFGADLNKRHSGFEGIIRLFIDLSATGRFDHVIDLHDVLRSKILRFLFLLNGVPVSVIDKGRGAKRELLSGKNRMPLKHTVERYIDTFSKAGFPADPVPGPWLMPADDPLKISGLPENAPGIISIGVAPYAKHPLKMWPEKYMRDLLSMISGKFNVRFFFFGGKEEAVQLESLASEFSGSLNTAGKLDLASEILLMSRLDLMIAMDSSNMHMASLTGIKVISIWGATDPLTGFGAWEQPDQFSISIPFSELTCRPCTVFGKGECRRGDLACMNHLTPEVVFNKMEALFDNISRDKGNPKVY